MSSLWCDKYRPTSLSKLEYHTTQAEQIKKLIGSGNFSHLFLFGPSGSGKKTRAYAILRELFGAGVEKLRLERKQFSSVSGKKLDLNVVSSNYHIEVNPSDVGFFDRVVVQQLIKEVATSATLTDKHSFKIVVITEADKLTRDAQHALRRTLEKYAATCRIILIGESCSRLTPAVRSRCLMLRIAAPTVEQISAILLNIAKKEVMTVTKESADRLANDCDRNLRRAILMLETYQVRGCAGDVPQPQWKNQISLLAKRMLESQSLERVGEIRDRFYQLQTHLVPSELVMRQLVDELLPHCLDDKMRSELIGLAADCEHKMRLGSKTIYHYEAFAVKFMSLFKKAVENVTMDFDEDF